MRQYNEIFTSLYGVNTTINSIHLRRKKLKELWNFRHRLPRVTIITQVSPDSQISFQVFQCRRRTDRWDTADLNTEISIIHLSVFFATSAERIFQADIGKWPRRNTDCLQRLNTRLSSLWRSQRQLLADNRQLMGINLHLTKQRAIRTCDCHNDRWNCTSPNETTQQAKKNVSTLND